MTSRNNAALGIGLMVLSCFCAAGNSAFAKGLMLVFPFALVLLVRSLTAIALLLPVTRPDHFRAAPRPGLQLFRLVLCGIEVLLYFYALAHLPIVDVMTYYLATPIYVTAISAVILREHVGWRRWSAVLVGFLGVLIALRPSAAMLTWPALIALIGSLFYAGVLSTTRALRGTPANLLLLSQLSGVLVFAAIGSWMNWVAPTFYELVLMSGLGVITLISSFCTIGSLKLAPASVVVPYQYTLILWGGLFGYLFFDEWPQVTTLIGAAVIIAAGLYIFLREQALSRRSLPVVGPA